MTTPSILFPLTALSYQDSAVQNAVILRIIQDHTKSHLLCPVGGKIFCVFQILSGKDKILDWRGLNVQTAGCVDQEDGLEHLITVTYQHRLSNPEGLVCIADQNIHHPTFKDTGLTYLTPHKPSYLLLALLPESR